MTTTTKFKAITKEEVSHVIQISSLPDHAIKIDGRADYLHQEFQDFEDHDLSEIYYNCGEESFPTVWRSKEEALDNLEDKENFCIEVGEDDDFDYEF